MKPRCLDLFCGGGGAGMGLSRAGFEVVGVDIRPQKHYPFEFHQADAMTFPLDGYDFIWASPPCQGYSRTRHLPWLRGKVHPLLIPATRKRLLAQSVPWVIENVGDAPLRGCVLVGEMFGLPFHRLRVFECCPLILSPEMPPSARGVPGRNFGSRLSRQRAQLDCPWMNDAERAQAIPPAYSQWVGERMMPFVLRVRDRGGVAP